MHYALLFYEAPDEIGRRANNDATYWAGWKSYIDMVSETGHMRGGNGLAGPETKTLVRNNGSLVVEDGPFAEAREELGGFVIVEADDIDGALKLAKDAPCTKNGYVEVRPCLAPVS